MNVMLLTDKVNNYFGLIELMIHNTYMMKSQLSPSILRQYFIDTRNSIFYIDNMIYVSFRGIEPESTDF
jgi:hypothetical protein